MFSTRIYVKVVLPAVVMIFLFSPPGLTREKSRQAIPSTDTIRAAFLKHIGDSLSENGKRNQANPYYEQAERIYASANLHQKRFDILYRLVFNLIYTGNRNRDVVSLLDTTKSLLEKYLPQDTGLHARYFFLMGCRDYFLGHYPESIPLFRESIRMASGTTLRWSYRAAFHRYLALACQGIHDFTGMERELQKALAAAKDAEAPAYQYAWDLHELSILYVSYLGMRKKGIEYGLKALEAYKSAPSPNPDMIIQMTTTIGLYYQRGYDLSQADRYFTQAENLILQNHYKNNFLLKNLYSNIGGWYRKQSEYEKAMEYYRKVANIENESDQGVSVQTCLNMFRTNYYLGDTAKAITWINKAQKRAQQLVSDPFGYLYRVQNFLGFIYLGRHQPEKALPFFFQAIKGYKALYGEHHPWVSTVNANVAECYDMKGLPDSALYYIQQAIISNLPGFTDTDIYTNPHRLNALDRNQLLGDLWKKARLLAGRSNTPKDITASTQTWLLASALIDTIRISFRDEKTRLFYTTQVQQIYDDAITQMARFYSLTSDPEYMEEAFKLSDKTKAINLLSALRTRKAIMFSHVPDSLQIQEQQWTEQMGTLHEMLYAEKHSQGPDSRKIDMLEEGIFRLSVKLDSLAWIMEKRYPAYYNLKYNTRVISAGKIRKKLSHRQALLSYHLTEKHLFSFCITNKQMFFTDQPVDSSFSVSIRNLAESFAHKNTFEYTPENIATTLQYLDRILIRPFDSIIGNKSLLIIPDGILLKVPFDLLLTDTGNGSLLPERNTPPYLIFRQPVYYDYSATLHFEKGLDRKNLITRILAIAPDYPANGLHLKNLSVIRRANDLILNPLPYAREEIKYVRKFTPGTTVTGDEATEAYFKRHAYRYDILHLTMHTILNDKNPLYSKLVFSQEPDTLEDGLLNTWEIYGLNLKAKMAVLSACNTGSGRIRQGEGMMSLARGFKYAGVSTLVTTRWEVEDKAGAELMELFYRNLRRGVPADIALQNAKITFLAHTDPLRLDPYYWSGYSLIGRPQRLFHPWKPAVMIILVVISFILSGTYLRKKQKNLQDNRLKDGS